MAIYSPPGNSEGCYSENVLSSSTQQKPRDSRQDENNKELEEEVCEKICYEPISEFSAFHYQCLKSINDCRKEHNVPDLNLSLDCCEHSLGRAKYILEANSLDTLEISYGESVYMEDINDENEFATSTIIKDWYKEGKLYNYAEPGFNSKTANFTQMVWKNTTHMGAAVLKSKGKTIFVINYVPPGNKRGHYSTNVLVPTCNQLHTGHELTNNPDSPQACPHRLPSPRRPETPHLTHTISDESAFNAFQKEILNAHNEVRSFHKSEPLVLDSALCDMAKTWAQVK